MKIYEIKQTKDGRQERPYADNIYEWSIWGQFPNGEEEVLQFCKTYLHDAKHEEKEYFNWNYINAGKKPATSLDED